MNAGTCRAVARIYAPLMIDIGGAILRLLLNVLTSLFHGLFVDHLLRCRTELVQEFYITFLLLLHLVCTFLTLN